MPRLIRKNYKTIVLSFLAVYALAGQPPEFGQENLFFQGYPINKPVVRIALAVNQDDMLVQASSGMKIYEVSGSYKLLAEDAPQAHIVGRKEKLSEKFLVQAGQFRRREDAEAEARALRERTPRRVAVTGSADAGGENPYQVRIGDFLTRGEALSFAKTLADWGRKDGWILREDVTEAENRFRWLLINDQLLNLGAESALYFIPVSTDSFLTYRGRNYRGIFMLRGSRRGLVLINILNMEDYLKGVVPGELPPSYFDRIEAQKAQAVAARTYALKNTGLYSDLGFDLYATPVSQVYLGLSAEHPMSNRAVEETAGEALVYEGKLINAMYMSTCGGTTENVEAMFDGPPVPYLRSTPCVLEEENRWPVQSPVVFPPASAGRKPASYALAELTALGIIPLETKPEAWREPAEGARVAAWLQKALPLLGKRYDRPAPEAALLDFPALARLLVDAFGWGDRAAHLMLKNEAGHVLDGLAAASPAERDAAAYLVLTGVYPRTPEIADPNRRVTRAEAAFTLHRMLTDSKSFGRRGVLSRLDGASLIVQENDAERRLEPAAAPLLFQDIDGSRVASGSLIFEAGDTVRWVESEGRTTLLELVTSSAGDALDQTSQFHRWQARISRTDLEARINQYYPVGRLIDVVPEKRGESGRVIEMAILGQESQVRARGMRIRQVLNLRDNLFVVDREYDPEGRVAVFVFSGKGWGHGVGLCQIGAFRLAQKGKSYEDILKKYYRGVKLEKMY